MVVVVCGDRPHKVTYFRHTLAQFLSPFRSLQVPTESIFIQLNMSKYQMHGMIVLGQVPEDGFSVNYRVRNMRNDFTYLRQKIEISLNFHSILNFVSVHPPSDERCVFFFLRMLHQVMNSSSFFARQICEKQRLYNKLSAYYFSIHKLVKF